MLRGTFTHNKKNIFKWFRINVNKFKIYIPLDAGAETLHSNVAHIDRRNLNHINHCNNV